MKCLVTGGAGFIGSNLTERLLAEGWQVTVLDDLSTGKLANLSTFLSRIEFIEGDIRDAGLLEKAASGCGVVFHQAALPSVPRSIADPARSHDVNVNGSLNVLLAARNAGVQRVVLASSSSVYGDSPVLPRSEDLNPRPLSPYAAGKLSMEYYARVFSAVYGLETVCLRYFNVFGPRQDPESPYAAVIPRFMRAIRQNHPPVVFGDGSQSRDFTFVDQVCQANCLAATAVKPLLGEVCNVGCGRSYSILDLLGALKEIMGRPELEPEFQPARAGDVLRSLADIRKARELLGYSPRSDFKAELELTCRWFESMGQGNGTEE
jgi:nucleoside-diphosphate-sugar epimerase